MSNTQKGLVEALKNALMMLLFIMGTIIWFVVWITVFSLVYWIYAHEWLWFYDWIPEAKMFMSIIAVALTVISMCCTLDNTHR